MNNEKNSRTDCPEISKATIKRLPEYLRTLRILVERNKLRVSSTELAEMMNATSSQIRRDLSTLGNFGLQGYGYDVKTLYTSILGITGVRDEYTAVIVGTKDIISLLEKRPLFARHGVSLKKTFDESQDELISSFEKYCALCPPDIVVLATSKKFTQDIVSIIGRTPVKGVWNFTDNAIKLDIPVKNLFIDDSIMTLCYEISRRTDKKTKK